MSPTTSTESAGGSWRSASLDAFAVACCAMCAAAGSLADDGLFGPLSALHFHQVDGLHDGVVGAELRVARQRQLERTLRQHLLAEILARRRQQQKNKHQKKNRDHVR